MSSVCIIIDMTYHFSEIWKLAKCLEQPRILQKLIMKIIAYLQTRFWYRCGRRGRMVVRARHKGGLCKFLSSRHDGMDLCTQEVAVAVVSCIIPNQPTFLPGVGRGLWAFTLERGDSDNWWFLEDEQPICFNSVAHSKTINVRWMSQHAPWIYEAGRW